MLTGWKTQVLVAFWLTRVKHTEVDLVKKLLCSSLYVRRFVLFSRIGLSWVESSVLCCIVLSCVDVSSVCWVLSSWDGCGVVWCFVMLCHTELSLMLCYVVFGCVFLSWMLCCFELSWVERGAVVCIVVLYYVMLSRVEVSVVLWCVDLSWAWCCTVFCWVQFSWVQLSSVALRVALCVLVCSDTISHTTPLTCSQQHCSCVRPEHVLFTSLTEQWYRVHEKKQRRRREGERKGRFRVGLVIMLWRGSLLCTLRGKKL